MEFKDYGASTQIITTSKNIENNIQTEGLDLGTLSNNIINHLRNLVESVMFIMYEKETNQILSYEYKGNKIKRAISYTKKYSKYKVLNDFHKQLQISISHYATDGDNSERLLLKYLDNLYYIKKFIKDEFNVDILNNLDTINLYDESKHDYYLKIYNLLERVSHDNNMNSAHTIYYVENYKPIFIEGNVYYELTLSTGTDRRSKFDRVIAFSKFKIKNNYSIRANIIEKEIEIFEEINLPIKIVRDWRVSIRICELNNFAKYFYRQYSISTTKEYTNLMKYLTNTGYTLLDIVLFNEEKYNKTKDFIIDKKNISTTIFNMLDRARKIIRKSKPGSNILRYFLYNMKNVQIKKQFYAHPNNNLSKMHIQYGSIPFEEMPFCTSLINHNPKLSDLLQSIELIGREHELLARKIQTNTMQHSKLYTHINELDDFEDVHKLVKTYNEKIYYKHQGRKIKFRNDHFFIKSHEKNTVEILNKLKSLQNLKIDNYRNYIKSEMDKHQPLDDKNKVEIIENMFENSTVAAIYGSAGTGKTYLLEKFSMLYPNQKKLFLANTNTAVSNLKERISTTNSTFSTVNKNIKGGAEKVDILIIDEASTISNEDMVEILRKNKFEVLIIVGDIYQIESIRYGNWFTLLPNVIKENCYELENRFRTKDALLLNLWDSVRRIENIDEHLSRKMYSKKLGKGILDKDKEDEIILCLNYDGLYGINNLNLLLQLKNPNKAYKWDLLTYKVGDPIIFNETLRFSNIIHNNSKGTISKIEKMDDEIIFEIIPDFEINTLGISREFKIIKLEDNKIAIRFNVVKTKDADKDTEGDNNVVPFQVSYAISIHKAQGLEYNSVKVVISDEYEDRITHNIFYTAITRTKNNLEVYWSKETQRSVIEKFKPVGSTKDFQLMKSLIK